MTVHKGNTKYPKIDTYKKSDIPKSKLDTGNLNGKLPFYYSEENITIYSKSKEEADRMMKLIINRNKS
jgi:hypothetical protein